ncbi:hypothetical protein QC762_500408 [Podospora pseudocomata]|uniref:Uncharacterized protein n=1 Tax=Podospora pseudocomata TaxID=2093779 RepID=A0ABR0GAV9_9PEZI|nr:hypothetical protein QC762_500408 [Podospora pseudocomata]
MTLLPPLGRLRLASPENILRLGVVCTSGFRYSEHFIWERTAHDRHPRNTVTFFRHEVAEFIKTPELSLSLLSMPTTLMNPPNPKQSNPLITFGHRRQPGHPW